MHRLRSFLKLLSDCAKIPWLSLYWNVRKSISPGSCQDPSDSGKASETGCLALYGLHGPTRLKFVCAHLVQTSRGYRCGIDHADIRPAWGLFFKLWFSFAAGIYLIGAHALFLVFFFTHVPLGYIDCLDFFHWNRIPVARAAHFRDEGFSDYRKGNLQSAALYLSLAYSLDPTTDTGLLLADIYQHTNPPNADHLYPDLLTRVAPNARESLAQGWAQSLLYRNEWDQLRSLATREQSKSQEPIYWLKLYWFSLRKAPHLAASWIADNASAWGSNYASFFRSEAEHLKGRESYSLLRQDPPNMAVAYYEASQLLKTSAAFSEKIEKLSPDLKVLLILKYQAFHANERLLETQFESLIVNPVSYQILILLLLEYPNPKRIELLWQHLSAQSEKMRIGFLPTLLLSAMKARNGPLSSKFFKEYKKLTHLPLVGLTNAFSDPDSLPPWQSVLNYFPPVSPEVIYALEASVTAP